MTEKTKNTLTRILSAVIALPIFIIAIYTDFAYSTPILIVSVLISLITLHEFFTITNRESEGKPLVVLGLLMGLFINIAMYLYAYSSLLYEKGVISHTLLMRFDVRLLLVIVVLFISIILGKQVFKGGIKGSIYSISCTIFGNIYIVLFFSHIILMKSLKNGVFYIIILNILVMINDTAAYFGGWLFGKHKTKLEVSPNKTWEGYISGFIVSIITMYFCNEICANVWNVQLFGKVEALLLGAALSFLGFLGDLVESLIKRDAVKKDSGTIIPGHGGMWDAFDALIFSLPLFYYYLVVKGVY